MTNFFTLTLVAAIIISCFHIDSVTSLKPERKLRLSRRVLTTPDPSEALNTLWTGAKGLFAITQHTIDGEMKLTQKAQPASSDSGGSSDGAFGVTPAAKVVAPAGDNK